MKANELRVNNIVIYNDVELIISEYCETIILLSNLKPIELTEEWLLKFGFQSIKHNNYYLHPFTFRENKIRIGYKTSTRHLANDIKYVHQLQNLYFAIMGEELIS